MSIASSEPSPTVLLNQLHPDWVSMDIEHLGKSFYNGEDAPLSDAIKSLKAKTLNEALANRQYDVLYEYAKSSDGLVNNTIRAKAWPILLGVDDHQSTYSSPPLTSTLSSKLNSEFNSDDELSNSESSLTNPQKKLNLNKSTTLLLDNLNLNDLPPHKDEDQIRLDINRSFTILSNWQSFHQQSSQLDSYTTILSKNDVEELRKKLFSLIIKMLRKHPSLNYYQGYHDIASVILIICYENCPNSMNAGTHIDEELAFSLLEKLTIFHLRDFMIVDIQLSINHLRLIPTLLENIDSSFFHLIKQTSNSYISSDGLYYDYSFYQAISSIITLFSHDINNLKHLLTIWDFILGHNSILTSIYIYTAFLLAQKEEIFKTLHLKTNYSDFQSIDEDDGQYDYSNVDADVVHTLISPLLLFQDLTDAKLIKVLNKANCLINDYPISKLDNSERTFTSWFNGWNKHSVLLNTSKSGGERTSEYNFLINYNNGNLSKTPSYNQQNPSNSETFPRSLQALIQLQDEEMAKQKIHDLEVQRSIFDQQESLSNSFSSLSDDDTAKSYLQLSSSLSSITSVSSSINTKIARTSSRLFKKLFHPSDDEDNGKKVVPRNKNFSLVSNLYKISFTIGFIGFMIHFLVIKDNERLNHFNVFKLFNSSVISPLKEMNINESLQGISHEFTVYGGDLVSDVGDAINVVFNYVKDADFVTQGMNFGQIGLGNLRDTVFGIIR